MTVTEVKNFIKVDFTDDDVLIGDLITAAEVLIFGQTGKTLYKGAAIATDKLYNLAIKFMVAHWYEFRGIVVPGQLAHVPDTAGMIINHIGLCGDYT